MKWEHATSCVWNSDVQSTMNERGEDGWELVSVLEWGDDKLMLFFKRPSREQAP